MRLMQHSAHRQQGRVWRGDRIVPVGSGMVSDPPTGRPDQVIPTSCQIRCNNVRVTQPAVRGRRAALAGSVELCLVEGLLHLDERKAVLDAMVEGWVTQMTSRGLKVETVRSGRWMVRRFAEFTNEYPWQWSPTDLEAFTMSLRSRAKPLEWSTIRGYQNQLGTFMSFVTDSRYGWAADCEKRFGTIRCRSAMSGTPFGIATSTRAARAGGR